MKTKIVEYIAFETHCALCEAIGEVNELKNKPQFLNRREGVGLDLQVLSEKLDDALKLINLLTKKDYSKDEE